MDDQALDAVAGGGRSLSAGFTASKLVRSTVEFRAVVLAYHVSFSCYGFWLPNDPRGSWSDWGRSWELLRYGSATKVVDRRPLAKRPHDRAQRLEARKALRHPPVVFDGAHARAVGVGFASACAEAGYIIHGCAVMPDHVHLVVARHDRLIEQVVRHLKGRATQQLKADGLHPLTKFAVGGEIPTPWARGTGWVVYLDSVEDITRSIRYVEANPDREELPRQRWSFVTLPCV